MNKWKVSFFVCCTALVLVTTVLIYNVLDLGISYTYLEQSHEEQLQANKTLGNLIVKGSQQYTQKDFLHLLRLEYPSEFIVEDGDKITMGWNVFKFKSNKLISAE